MKISSPLLLSTIFLSSLNASTYTNIATGDWNQAIWAEGGFPNSPTAQAFFGSSNTTVTVNDTYEVESLSFSTMSTTGYSCIIESASGQLNLEGASSPGIYFELTNSGANNTQTINCPLSLHNDITISINSATTALFNAGATIGGNHSLTLSGTGLVTFAGTQSYTGSTTIDLNTTFATSEAGILSESSDFVVDGTLDLMGNPNSINSLSGDGTIKTGDSVDAILTILNGGTTYTATTVHLGIIGSGGITVHSGDFTLENPADVNIYSGPTKISADGTLIAADTNCLSQNSDFTVNGTLELAGYPNTIKSLTGTGIIQTGGSIDGVLTLLNGGTYSATSTITGGIIGSGGITVQGGEFILYTPADVNSYTGPTTIFEGATLLAPTGYTNCFSTSSDFFVNGTLSLNNNNIQIQSLSGASTGIVYMGDSTGPTLTITNGSNGGSFSGTIIGSSVLNLTGGTLTFESVSGLIDYFGSTTLTYNSSNPTILVANATNTLPQNSPFTVNGATTLQINESNQIQSLTGPGDILLASGAILTVTNGNTGGTPFSGYMTGDGGFQVGSTTPPSSSTFVVSSAEGQNTYSGSTTIEINNTLQAALSTSNCFSTASDFFVNGTLDLNSNNIQIQSLSAASTGIVSMGDGATLLITDGSNGGIFYGAITGSSALNLTGGTLTFESATGLIAYTGATTLSTSGTILAASAENTLPQNSAFTINSGATLQINDSNQILSLTGAGNVTLASGTILTVTDGNTSSSPYLGYMSGDGGFEINSVSSSTPFVFSSPATQLSYSGDTLITSGILQAAATSTFSTSSPFIIGSSGTLDLSGYDVQLNSLQGSGIVSLGSNNLQVTNGTNGDPSYTESYSGSITGTLGTLNITGGLFVLASEEGSNTYTGATTISNSATLEIAATNAASFFSAIQLQNTSTLWINEVEATIPSLVGAAGTTLALDGSLNILGVAVTAFDGQITGGTTSDKLTIGSGYHLTLNNVNNNYVGPTQIDGELIIAASGALSPYTAITIGPSGELVLSLETTNTALSCTNTGILSNSGVLNLTDTYTQTSDATLDLILYPSTVSASQANLSAVGTIFAAGALSVYGSHVSPATGTTYLIVESGNFIAGSFDITTTGFTPEPSLFYTRQEIALYFAHCSASWVGTDGFWGEGTNWSGGSCIPGASGNEGDIATFGESSAHIALVTLADSIGTSPFSVTLLQLDFSGDTSYTLAPHTDSTITMDSPISAVSPQISVSSLLPQRIEAPIILNANTNLLLADGANLTLSEGNTLTSSSSNLTLLQYPGFSIFGSGNFTNDGEISVKNLNLFSASFTNSATAEATNKVAIGGSGNLIITNSGTDAFLTGSTMTISGSNTINITNDDGQFGPSGKFTINAPNALIVNSGEFAVLAAMNNGSNVLFQSGKIVNQANATFKAGDGGQLTIKGGQITNDRQSIVGSTSANLKFTNGLIDNSGIVIANQYKQKKNATLQLNLITSPTLIGNVKAVQTATLNGTLIVEALPGSNPKQGQVIPIITAPSGITGEFSKTLFEGFSDHLIPAIVYNETVVDLIFSSTLSSNTYGSIPLLVFLSINNSNFLVQKDLFALHRKIQAMDQPNDNLVAAFNLKEPQRLIQRVQEEPSSPWRVYLGPTVTAGHLDKLSVSQPSLSFDGYGLYGGFDYASKKEGIGSSMSYTKFSGSDFDINQLHASAYGIALCQNDKALAFQAIIGGGYDWFSTSRDTGTNVAKAHFNGWEFDALAGIEYTFSCFPITPIANLEYMQLQTFDFDETSAGIYDLHVKGQTQRALFSLLGLRLDYLFTSEHASLRPQFDLGWQYQMLNNSDLEVSTINLSTIKAISSPIITPSRNSLWVGLDFLLTLYDQFQIELSYDLQWSPSYVDNSAYLGFGGTF